MGKLGFLGIFVVVSIVHLYALQSHIKKENLISKPKAKVHRITLSSVVVKKPVVVPPKPDPIVEVKHLVEPIILPPDPEPVVKPKRVKKPKKKKHKKKVRKKRVIKKPIRQEEPVIREVVPEPIVEQVVAPVVVVDTSSIIDAYTSQIRRQIRKHLVYPKRAKRMRMQGMVRVAFRVLKDGTITDIRVVNSSKKLLSKGAIKTLKALSLRAIPRELKEQFLDINIPIEFKLIKG